MASSCRMVRITARFIARASIVVRPISVRPTRRTPCHWKCSFQLSRRGLNKTTSLPVCGSLAVWRAAFRSEQETQTRARLSREVCPPAATGMTWSMWNVASCPSWANSQYSQRPAALRRTSRRNSDGIARIIQARHPAISVGYASVRAITTRRVQQALLPLYARQG